MDTELSEAQKAITGFFISLLFMISSLLPFIGPAMLALLFGRNDTIYKTLGISTEKIVIAAFFGEGYYALILLDQIPHYFKVSPTESLSLIIIYCFLTFFVTAAFMKIGVNRSKNYKQSIP